MDDLNWKKERDLNSLIPEQRRAIIFDLVRQRGLVGVQELSDLTDTSVSTVRRDLAELEQRGSVKRTHGGAMLNLSLRTTFEPEYEFASQMSQPEKEAIGRAAIAYLQEGQSIIFDSSSTVYQAAKHVVEKGLPLTAVTNDVNIANVLAKSRSIKLQVLGGTLRPGSFTLLGEPGLNFLAGLHVDICLLGTHAIHIDPSSTIDKLSDTSIEVATTKRCMVETARRTILLADSNKFGSPAFCDVCDLDQLDVVITDNGIGSDQRNRIEKQGLELTIAQN